MQRQVRTSVVCVLGQDAESAVRDLGGDSNVRAVLDADTEPGPLRAMATWSAAVRTASPWFVHVDDPLADVAAGWLASAGGDPAPLAVAAQQVTARWRAETLELPDWYLVLLPTDADTAAVDASTRLALEVLADASPHRVLLARRGEERRTLRRVTTGRWWPDLPDLLADLPRRPPGLTAPRAPATGGPAGDDVL